MIFNKKSFKEIGEIRGTDKITHHGYHRFYPIFIDKFREKPITLLEIGIDRKRSLEMWKDYFPKAKIFGIDINIGFKHDRGEVFKGDQSHSDFLNRCIKKIGKKIDIIVDDGSHVPEHQLKTFCHLFALLNKGGVYIIEDIETNYWTDGICYGYKIQKGYKHPKSVIEIFKDVVDGVNEEFIYPKSILNHIIIPRNLQKEIGMITFCQNCIIIVKKDKEYKNYNFRKYRFKKFIKKEYH